MADHLYLSYWLHGFSGLSMMKQFGRMLDKFPYSPQNPGPSVLRIEAIAASEPPLVEEPFGDPVDPREVLSAAKEFVHEDNAYFFETWWGLWLLEKDWVLRPTRATLACFGPGYGDTPLSVEDGQPEHLRIDFGLESGFLPIAGQEDSSYYAQSNLKGLLHFTHSLDNVLQVDRRLLWSESGESFAEKLRNAADDL